MFQYNSWLQNALVVKYCSVATPVLNVCLNIHVIQLQRCLLKLDAPQHVVIFIQSS